MKPESELKLDYNLSDEKEVDLSFLKEKLLESLRAKAREELQRAMLETIGNGDVILLSGMGLDGQRVMLEAFVLEAQKLIKELETL